MEDRVPKPFLEAPRDVAQRLKHFLLQKIRAPDQVPAIADCLGVDVEAEKVAGPQSRASREPYSSASWRSRCRARFTRVGGSAFPLSRAIWARGAGEGATQCVQIPQKIHSMRFRDALPPQPGAAPARPGAMASHPRQGASPPSAVPQTGRSGGGSGSPSAKTRQATFEERWAGPRPGSGPGRNRKSHSRRVSFHWTVSR